MGLRSAPPLEPLLGCNKSTAHAESQMICLALPEVTSDAMVQFIVEGIASVIKGRSDFGNFIPLIYQATDVAGVQQLLDRELELLSIRGLKIGVVNPIGVQLDKLGLGAQKKQ